jgi:hypothetical protein
MKALATTMLAATLCCTGPAHATLYDRGGGLIYDDVLNLTWLQDANYAQTSGASATGVMSWAEANAWAANLNYFDSVRGVTWSDWRLPKVKPINGSTWNLAPTYNGSSDWSYSITSPQHEIAHLFHVSLKNLSGVLPDGTVRPGVSGTDYGMVNTGPFVKLYGDIYWSGTASPWYPADHALAFLGYSGGDPFNTNVLNKYRAIAVRDGDVARCPSPKPAR